MGRRKNGLGSFEKLPNGNLRMRKQFGTLPNGRPRILTVTGSSETDCLKKMRLREDETGDQCFDSGAIRKITLSELCYRHLNEHLSERGRLKPKSADRRESTIRNQIEPYRIGRLQALAVSPTDINKHIELLIKEGKVSVSSIVKTLDVINAAYKWAKDQYYTEYNPCTPVQDRLKTRLKNLEKRDSSDGVVIVLSKDQAEQLTKMVDDLCEKAKPYRYLMGLSMLFLLHTGMRVGELCALRWCDWSESSNTLTISKTRNITKNRNSKGPGDTYIPNENSVKNYHARTIALTGEAAIVLAEMKRVSPKTDPTDYILLGRSNEPSNPSNYDSNISKLYRLAGLPDEISGAHILRRTCATMMHDNGCRIEDIAAYLGDTTETIQKHYISLTKKIVADGEVKNVVQVPRKQG